MADVARVDCLVIGGGPGGLTAAIYLSRFKRTVAVVDAGESRLKLIPLSRNIPGFPDGVSGVHLHERMRAQARKYGTSLIEGRVTRCVKQAGEFLVESSAGQFVARAVLLATGVDVKAPDMAELPRAIAEGKVRYCPICDGYEAGDASIGVLGGRAGAIEEARFLRTFSSRIVYLSTLDAPALSRQEVELGEKCGIEIESSACVGLSLRGAHIEAVLASGGRRKFDVVYPCLGTRPRSEIAEALGARLSDHAELITDAHFATNVSDLYAVGDVLRGLDQVASACGQAAIAATAIHNRLREND